MCIIKAWYFTYDDLRPLILPLILGGRNDAYQIIKQAAEIDEEYEEEEEDMDELAEEVEDEKYDQTETGVGEPPNNNSDEDIVEDAGSGGDEGDGEGDELDENDGFVEVEADEEDEDEEDAVEREGLSQNGPISVLEIGCGDVPLGAGLALELKELEEKTGESASKVVKQICCSDYSSSVQQAMRAQYKQFAEGETRPKHSADIGNIPLEFVVADARKLKFEPHSFELILEKGTLDAMLSDKVEGVKNCVQIMRECARVLAKEGFMVLVSHLNAHTERGQGWLQDVVFEGLQSGDPEAAYSIEVHGNAEIHEDSRTALAGTCGPAVYIIRKKEKETSCTNEQKADATIPVKFYSY